MNLFIIFIIFAEARGSGTRLHSLGNRIDWSRFFCFVGISFPSVSPSLIFEQWEAALDRNFALEEASRLFAYFVLWTFILCFPSTFFCVRTTCFFPSSCSWHVVATNFFFLLSHFSPVPAPPTLTLLSICQIGKESLLYNVYK